MAQIAIRLPAGLVTELDEAASRQQANRSELVRRAVEAYLYRLACERDAAVYAPRPLSDSELALADDPSVWDSAPSW